MEGNFNTQILVDKLAKLNSSQQSIETLSHWCIFHRKNARQVVETWQRQFHCSPQSQRVSFLFLANDILQNSRWKGAEFVGEFWKVLPDALNSVVAKGDEFGRNTALRLVDIWDDRKVFGSRGKTLKEELLGGRQEKHGKNGISVRNKIKQPIGNVLEKLILSYEHVYDGSFDEDIMLSKCRAVITYLEKMENEIGNGVYLGNKISPKAMDELLEKPAILRECIQQLKAIESSRVTLVSQLREALHEQEFKLEVVRNQLQAAEARSELAASISERLTYRNNGQLPLEQRPKEAILCPEEPPNYDQGCQVESRDKEMSTPVIYSQQGPLFDNGQHSEASQQKTAGTEVVTQQMGGHASDSKRVKLEDDMPYTPPHPPEYLPEPLPPLPDHDSPPQMTSPQPIYQQPPPFISQPGHSAQGPPLQPPMRPTMQPIPPPTPYMQIPPPYSYVPPPLPQWTPSLPGYPMVNMLPYPSPPPNPYQNMQAPESGGFPNQPSVSATAQPIFRP